MFVSKENWQDGEKYFAGCYIKVKEYSDTLCKVIKVTEEAIWCEDEHGNNVCIELDGAVTGKVGYDLDYILPKRAFFQLGDFACFLNRIPARMWKKGLCKQNTALYQVTHTGTFSPASLTFENLHAYVHKPFYSPTISLDGLYSKALSPRFALTKDGTLLLDMTKIGQLTGTKTILVKKIFVPEVSKLLPETVVKGI